MERALTDNIRTDLAKKIVFITGPRQVGKTTLAKSLSTSYEYLNYDYAEHRLTLRESSWDRGKDLVIFDELHKMPQWKGWLKGIYDAEGIPPQYLVTGSAKLDTYKKVGDSLAGRYFQYRLHPLDLKEIKNKLNIDEAFTRLWDCSGFPEPFLQGEQTYYRRWKSSHLDIILRQDLIDIQSVHDIKAIETLILLLKNSVGSTISYANLARTLERDAKTIKRWLQLLENLYIIFKITPYAKNITRSLLKEPKYYFYDFVDIKDSGAKLENIVAAALIKEIDSIKDVYGITGELNYLRTKEGKEIDFLITIDNQPTHMIEVKSSNDNPSKHFTHFSKFLPNTKPIQLVRKLKREKTYPNGVDIRNLITWLSSLDLRPKHPNEAS